MNGIAATPVAKLRPRIYWGVVLALGIATLLYAFWPRAAYQTKRNPERRLYVDVKRVLSGQKVKLDMDEGENEYLIYAGIRAPYTEEPFFNESLARNSELVYQKEVRLRFGKQKYDDEGRALAYVFVGDEFINETLVSEGLAYVRMTTANHRFKGRLLEAQVDARKHRRGIWSKRGRSGESSYPADPKYGNFHRPSCEEVPKINPTRRVNFKSARRAMDEGFAPCSKCKP